MKKLLTLKEFKKKHSDSCLNTKHNLNVKGGQGSWKSEHYPTGGSPGTFSDINNWFYGDGDNKGKIRSSTTYYGATGIFQVVGVSVN